MKWPRLSSRMRISLLEFVGHRDLRVLLVHLDHQAPRAHLASKGLKATRVIVEPMGAGVRRVTPGSRESLVHQALRERKELLGRRVPLASRVIGGVLAQREHLVPRGTQGIKANRATKATLVRKGIHRRMAARAHRVRAESRGRRVHRVNPVHPVWLGLVGHLVLWGHRAQQVMLVNLVPREKPARKGRRDHRARTVTMGSWVSRVFQVQRAKRARLVLRERLAIQELLVNEEWTGHQASVGQLARLVRVACLANVVHLVLLASRESRANRALQESSASRGRLVRRVRKDRPACRVLAARRGPQGKQALLGRLGSLARQSSVPWAPLALV